jgi:hypothetical protein
VTGRGPRDQQSLLKEWDLWGPLILCTFMATILQVAAARGTHSWRAAGGDGGPEFAEVFVIVWVGAMVVTLNTKLLGGSISSQAVCVISLTICLLLLKIAASGTDSRGRGPRRATVIYLTREKKILMFGLNC